ncbi:MAG: WGR domain-containing protein [Cyanobacteriota bacterium]|nr:WGR domain-containing protein [Cyanobacteriota bacterium]
MELVKRTTLHFQEGTSDKVYEVDLCRTEGGYLVNFRYGKRNAKLKEGTKTDQAVSLAKAEKLFEKLVRGKTRKGYRDVSPSITPAPSTEEKSENPAAEEGKSRAEVVLERLRNRDTTNWPLNRIIWRAGELKIREATPLLIPLLGTGKPLRDYSIVASLGRCGDRSAVFHLRSLHENPQTPEFIKRITWEALFKLADNAEKAQMQSQKIEELPPQLRDLARRGSCEELSEALEDYLKQTPEIPPEIKAFKKWLNQYPWHKLYQDTATGQEINARIEQLPLEWRSRIPKVPEAQPNRYAYWHSRSVQNAIDNYNLEEKSKLFILVDILYQIDNEQTRPVVLEFIRTASFQDTHKFQRLRHLFKMAEYRNDAEVFSIFACRIEREKAASYRFYSYQTRRYLRRRVWRTLRKLGEEGDSNYINLAVAVLLNYSDEDAQKTKKTTFYRWDYSSRETQKYTNQWDSFAPYLTFNHILYENSPRYHFMPGTKAWRCSNNYSPGDSEPEQREEAFPKLWERHPDALLNLLLQSRCNPVHHFATKALRVCQDFFAKIELDVLIQLLNRPYEVTTQFAFEIARERYDAENPNLELVGALIHCSFEPARVQARQWVEQGREIFIDFPSFLASLVLSSYSDTRLFARNFLSHAPLLSEDMAKEVSGRILTELLTRDRDVPFQGETNNVRLQEIGETLLVCFAPELRVLGLQIIQDLLQHPLAGVQAIGARLLLNHETPAAELPGGLIDSLIMSPHEEIRAIGVRIFGQLSDEQLLQEYDMLAAIATSSLPDLRQSVRPVIQRLANAHPDFAVQLATELINFLLLPEDREGVHQDIVILLRDRVPGWMSGIWRETAMKLLRAKSSAAQELGGLALSEHCQDWVTEFTTAEIVKLASHEIVSVREAARSMFLEIINRVRTNSQELLSAVRLLEAKWEDSRIFAREIFDTFSRTEWSPDVMVSICDSIREDVRQYGRNLVMNNFQQEYGEEYLLKFSEHPSGDMQRFATNYLEDYAAGNCDRLRQLTPYFTTVLCQINHGRVAKDRVFAFLCAEAQRSEEAARIVADILTQQSLTIAIGDKAKAIQTLLQIKQRYPNIEVPLQVKEVAAVRT